MKTTIDIPDGEIEDVVTAIADSNRRRRMADLVRFAGTCADLITPEELQAARWRG